MTSTKIVEINVAGETVRIVRKKIKNLHLGVYPPTGRVRVAAPLNVSNHAVRLAVITRLGWIKRQRAKFAGQPRQTEREMVSGETHYYLGRSCRLRVVEGDGPRRVVLRNPTTLELHVDHNTKPPERTQVLHRWYRERLRELVRPLVVKWEGRLGVRAAEFRIKTMKTMWGSCTRGQRRIWLNLELAKKPVQCIEYIIVHELAHFIERNHNAAFVALLDCHLPRWRHYRRTLEAAPLGHNTWKY